MPRKDQITGCMVMTTAEFWASEAEHEGQGRSAGELQSDFFKEWAADQAESRKEMYKPEVALQRLKEAVKTWNGDDVEEAKSDGSFVPAPVKVLEVVEVEYSETMGGYETKIVAVVEVEGGKTGTVSMSEKSWHGSFYEPPDYEVEVNWEERL